MAIPGLQDVTPTRTGIWQLSGTGAVLVRAASTLPRRSYAMYMPPLTCSVSPLM